MFIRYTSSVIFGLLITVGLILLMSALIATGKNSVTEETVGQVIDFIRVQQDETVRTKELELDKPEDLKPPPPTSVPKSQLDNLNIDKANLDTGFSVKPDIEFSADKLASSDGEYLPFVKIAPEYPRRALAQGVEGYVIVEFTVTRAGSVRDVKVISAEPQGFFEDAAIKAAEKFKYKPKIVGGEPVDVAGVRNKITFKMAK